jgi:hypothetical protein
MSPYHSETRQNSSFKNQERTSNLNAFGDWFLEIGSWQLGSWRNSWQYPSGERRMPGKESGAAISI